MKRIKTNSILIVTIFLLAIPLAFYFSLTANADNDTNGISAYAVFDEGNGNELIMYYDDEQSVHLGTVFDFPTSIKSAKDIPWYNVNTKIMSVAFDESFANFYPTSTAFLFYGMNNKNLKINLDNLNTIKVTDMTSMFYGCAAKSLDLSKLNTSSVTNTTSMFELVGNIDEEQTIDISTFNLTNVTKANSMFAYGRSNVNIKFTNSNFGQNCDISKMFYYTDNETIDLSMQSFNNVATAKELFSGSKSENVLLSKTLSFAPNANLYRLFYQSKIKSVDLSGLSSSNILTLEEAFSDTSTTFTFPTNLSFAPGCSLNSTFWGYRGLYLDISGFNLSNVTNMEMTFMGCESETIVMPKNISFNDKCSMSLAFTGCLIDKIDLSNFNINNVTNLDWIFSDCPNLTTIISSPEADWSKSGLKGNGMFDNCVKLVGHNGTEYDEAHTDIQYARVDTENTPGYFSYYTKVKISIKEGQETYGRLEPAEAYFLPGTTWRDEGNKLILTYGKEENVITAIPNDGYKFVAFNIYDTSNAEGTINENTVIEVEFAQNSPTPDPEITPTDNTSSISAQTSDNLCIISLFLIALTAFTSLCFRKNYLYNNKIKD